MDVFVKFYIIFFHNSEESFKINPSHNFGMQHENQFGKTLQELHQTLHCVCMYMHTHINIIPLWDYNSLNKLWRYNILLYTARLKNNNWTK